MNFKKEKAVATGWFIFILALIVFTSFNAGFGLFRFLDGNKNGLVVMIVCLVAAVVCSACAYRMCKVISNYAAMEKCLEMIATQEKFCEQLKKIHREMKEERLCFNCKHFKLVDGTFEGGYGERKKTGGTVILDQKCESGGYEEK